MVINMSFYIAIDGNSCAGKSTFAEKLYLKHSAKDSVNLFHMDDFFDDNYGRFRDEVLLPLKSGQAFTYRAYSCKTGEYREIEVKPARINIVEGVYSLHPRFDFDYDLKIFMKVAQGEQLRRIKLRSPDLYERFVNEWFPRENKYFEEFKIADKCDFVFEF